MCSCKQRRLHRQTHVISKCHSSNDVKHMEEGASSCKEEVPYSEEDPKLKVALPDEEELCDSAKATGDEASSRSLLGIKKRFWKGNLMGSKSRKSLEQLASSKRNRHIIREHYGLLPTFSSRNIFQSRFNFILSQSLTFSTN